MTYTYSLTVIDDEGNIVIDHPLTADHAVSIVAAALNCANKNLPQEKELPPATERKRGRSKTTDAKPAKSGKRKCSNCGRPGHISRNCPGIGKEDATPAAKKNRYGSDDARRNEGIMQALAKGEKPRHVAAQFGVNVSTVYNLKSRSKSEFAKAQRATREAQSEPEVRPASKPLDGDQYDAVRDAMHDRGFSSAEYALTKRLSPREVNAAIKSTDYDDYLDSR